MSLTGAFEQDYGQSLRNDVMQAGLASNMAMLPGQMQETQLRNEAMSLNNTANINQFSQAGMQPQMQARGGINLAGLPEQFSPDELKQLFEMTIAGQQIDPQTVERLRHSPGAGQLFAALQQP